MARLKLPSLPILIATACALGFVGSAVLNMIQFQHNQDNTKLLQGRITDLQYQYNLDHASPTPQPTEASAGTPTPTPAPEAPATPAVAGSTVVTIGGDLNIKLTATDPVADLTFWLTTSGQYHPASLTTISLKSKYSACGSGAANNALGWIINEKTRTTDSKGQPPFKVIGADHYFYQAPSGYCATDDAGKAALDTGRAAVKNTVLATVTQ